MKAPYLTGWVFALTVAFGTIAADEKPQGVETPRPSAFVQIKGHRYPAVFASDLLPPTRAAIIGDIEYIASFAVEAKAVPAEGDSVVNYLGSPRRAEERLMLTFPFYQRGIYSAPVGPLPMIAIDDAKAIFFDSNLINAYEESLMVLYEDPTRQKRLLEFLYWLRNVDRLLEMNPEEKQKMLPQLGEHFSVELFGKNVEFLRGFAFHAPPLVSLRRGEGALVGGKLIQINSEDGKMHYPDIVFYDGIWTFGYAGAPAQREGGFFHP